MIAIIVIAVLLTMLLVGSASARIADASQADDGSSGGWGIINRHSRRRRAMSPQARRWQTAISRASDDDVRWSQFVDYLDSLEASAGGSPDPTSRPESLDGRYLQSRIDGMQAQIDRSERDRNPTLTPSPTTSGNAGEETQ